MAPLVERNLLDLEPSYSPNSVWDNGPDQTAGFLSGEVNRNESPYSRASIWWGRDADSTTVESISIPEEPQDEIEDRGDPDLGDRLTLLVRKYANESTLLLREDSARLAILDRRVDLKYSRYGESDFSVITEADEILEKFKQLEEDDN